MATARKKTKSKEHSTTRRARPDGRRPRELRPIIITPNYLRHAEGSALIDCDVIEADGGTRTAAITGAYIALALAVAKLEAAGQLTGRVLVDSVAAVSVGICANRLCLDLAYAEDSTAEVDMNVVMTGRGR